MEKLLRSYRERFLALPDTLRLLAVVALIGIGSLYALGLVSLIAAPRLRQVPAAYAVALVDDTPTPHPAQATPGTPDPTDTPPPSATATPTPSPTPAATLTPTVTATLEPTPPQERLRPIHVGGGPNAEGTRTATAQPPPSAPTKASRSAATSPTPKRSATKAARPARTKPTARPTGTPTPRRR